MDMIFSLTSYYRKLHRKTTAILSSCAAAKSIIGLDINPTYIALAELRKLRNFSYELVAFAFIPVAYFERDYSDQSVIRQAIARAIIKAKIKSSKAVAAMPYSIVNTKTISLTYRLPDNAIENFLKLNCEKYLGQDAAKISFDYRIVSPSVTTLAAERETPASFAIATNVADKSVRYQTEISDSVAATALSNSAVAATNGMTLSVVIANRERVNKYAELLDKTPLKLAALDVDIYALIRAIAVIYPEIERAYTVIHLDYARMLVGVIEGDEVVFAQESFLDEKAKSSDAALQQFVCDELRFVDGDEKENNSKRKNNGKNNGKNSEENNDMMTHGVIMHSAIVHTEKILLCGTNVAVFSRLITILNKKTNIPVVAVDPFRTIKIAPHLQNYATHLHQIAPGMMLCCGLALHKNIYGSCCGLSKNLHDLMT